jgi:hypothetical protein
LCTLSYSFVIIDYDEGGETIPFVDERFPTITRLHLKWESWPTFLPVVLPCVLSFFEAKKRRILLSENENTVPSVEKVLYMASLERIREENTQDSEGPRILLKRVCTCFKWKFGG